MYGKHGAVTAGSDHHVRLRVPRDFAQPGGACEEMACGFSILAEDEKGALARLDRDLPENALTAGHVLYAARNRTTGVLLALRPADEVDRMQRFRRPAYLDRIEVECCGRPARYLSIHDHGSGRFFDLDVQPATAMAHAEGTLSYFFMCQACSHSTTLPL